MLKILTVTAMMLLSTTSLLAQEFDLFFDSKSLRIDLIHTANAQQEYYSVDRYYKEPYWGGSKINLIDTLGYGNYQYRIMDSASQRLIFSKGFSSLGAEWIVTPEAKTLWRSFEESIVLPFPHKSIGVEILKRKGKEWVTLTSFYVNPKSYLINTDQKVKIEARKIHYSGNTAQKIDIVILAEGYTASEMQKFMRDAQRFKDTLFSWQPFRNYTQNFNIWVVPTTSEESGTDIPGEGIFKNTFFDSHFYTFGTERYINTTHNRQIRDAAANAPYDQIYVLVNTDRYGGAGIYNFYSICTSDNPYSGFVFVHEFGHAFGGLGDEYFSDDEAVEEFYQLQTEPWEPNLTTLVDFESKWKRSMDASTPIPTPTTDEFLNKIGVFEGAGYSKKGIYRPFIDCSMKSIISNALCPVCQKALIDQILFYSK